MSGRGPPRIEGMTSLKVDNLTYRTTCEDLRRVFEKYGDVGDVYIPKDRFSRESRGFAFVRYLLSNKFSLENLLNSLSNLSFLFQVLWQAWWRRCYARHGWKDDGRQRTPSSVGSLWPPRWSTETQRTQLSQEKVWLFWNLVVTQRRMTVKELSFRNLVVSEPLNLSVSCPALTGQVSMAMVTMLSKGNDFALSS